MTFNTAHFGEGMLNESYAGFDASRLYSALFLEALKFGKEEEFFQLTNTDDFLLSDAYPYDVEPYLPKPIGYPLPKIQDDTDLKKVRQEAKRIKKINYIPLSLFDNYIKGEGDIEKISQAQTGFASTRYLVKKGEDPYEVGLTSFRKSLYVLATSSPLLDTLMQSLQYSGLGGKRSIGYGSFDLEIEDVPTTIAQNVITDVAEEGIYMLLTTSLPKENELDQVLKYGKYLLKRYGGFVYSAQSSEPLRKQDFYRFKSGSTFEKTFQGELRDVRPDNFIHPVWCYAKGAFYKLAI